ncbi:prepilin-type N-terminal cleavage/methylation domain-containing protein [Opitutaceae bacterium TAV1]|nr:prepilin-type N-terminal cleavage/methylation domain-containing protein [Opitutaceae bacterium TAV1]
MFRSVFLSGSIQSGILLQNLSKHNPAMPPLSTARNAVLAWPRPSRGFTLIELLVVIAIIGILAGLSVVGVSAARSRAAAAQCASRVRTLAMAHYAWRLDNKGAGPPTTFDKTHPWSEGHTDWGLRLLRRYYLSGPAYIWVRVGEHEFRVEKTEICPGARITGQTANAERGGPDYNMGVKAKSSSDPTSIDLDSFFQVHSKTPVIWDGWFPRGQAQMDVPLRHSGAINMGFMDGHVERVKGTDGRLYKQYMWSLYNTGYPDPKALGKGEPMGSTSTTTPD